MKFTVIGAAGRMGSMRARHLIEMGHHVYGVDPDPSWEGLGIVKVKEVPDNTAVIVATPAAQHIFDLSSAIDSGQHVFVEKPLCLIGETSRARYLLDVAREKNLIVAVGYNLRFHPAVMRVKDAIASGALRPMWGGFMLRQKPQRPLAHFLEEWASHEVDLARHLFGTTYNHTRIFDNGEDVFQVMLKHRGGFDISDCPSESFIHVDSLTEPPRRAFTIVDQDGQAVTCDIETDHVTEEHYKHELAMWVEAIERIESTEYGLEDSGVSRLATSYDGLAVIELLERLAR